MLEFPLNKLQILSTDCFYFFRLNYKIVMFLSQSESTPKHFLNKKSGFRSNNFLKIYVPALLIVLYLPSRPSTNP
jgi:hypothetical protein